mmetsp:Transcript_46783/g.111283  ORF Transcript_46783/g.111283 Transcript_46783/m.111283 type:complete len:266 (-) Transcript_46783:36-833(-)
MLAHDPTPLCRLAEADSLENGTALTTFKDGSGSEPLPDDSASVEEWSKAFPIESFPPLKPRGAGYISQAMLGCTIVSGLSISLVILTHKSAQVAEGGLEASWSWCLIKVWASIACLCTAQILLWNPNIIKRSQKTCYPIPEVVAKRLRASETLDTLHNIHGPPGSDRFGSYCVRCLVWRPPSRQDTFSHHCSICARCVTNFDHHCGVYGRCIVRGNMLAFYGNLAMLPLGIITALFAVASAPEGGVLLKQVNDTSALISTTQGLV